MKNKIIGYAEVPEDTRLWKIKPEDAGFTLSASVDGGQTWTGVVTVDEDKVYLHGQLTNLGRIHTLGLTVG